MTIWEDRSGVAAWVLTGPRHRAFDAQVRPDLRGGEFEREVLEHAEERLVELMRTHGIDGDRIRTEAFRCDRARYDLLVDLGWTPEGEPPYVVNRARIADLPEPDLPPGYEIRPVTGVEEAAALASLHLAAFPGAKWTPELYWWRRRPTGRSPPSPSPGTTS